jgi:multicomponent Na+:H+ antiporter subunit E
MSSGVKKSMGRISSALVAAVLFTAVYIVWSGSKAISDIAVFGALALAASLLFVKGGIFPRPGIKPVLYGIVYIPYLFIEIVKANFDVASRIVRPRIPLNPGIVAVKTRLKTPIGRAVLANSITLTPGTLSVEIKEEILYIHWIDVRGAGSGDQAAHLVEGFEKYLEVIFG